MFPTHADIQAALSTAQAHADTYGDGNKAGILARVIRELEQVGPELLDAASAAQVAAQSETVEEAPIEPEAEPKPKRQGTPLLKSPSVPGSSMTKI